MNKNIYRLLTTACIAVGLSACGGDSDNEDNDPRTYEEYVSFYKSNNLGLSDDSLNGVWVSILKQENTWGIDYEDIKQSSVEESIEIEIVSIKEDLNSQSLIISRCSTEPQDDGINLDLTFDDQENSGRLTLQGAEYATFDSMSSISLLEQEESSDVLLESDIIERSSSKSIKTLIKISDTYKESIGTHIIDGESRDTACFNFERLTVLEGGIDSEGVTSSKAEAIGVMFFEEGFIDGFIYDTVDSSGNYEDDFKAEFYLYDSYETINSYGSNGEAGFLNLSSDGPVHFSGESNVIVNSTEVITIEFDFQL